MNWTHDAVTGRVGRAPEPCGVAWSPKPWGDRPGSLRAVAGMICRGLRFGYPPCCTLRYALDVYRGRLPAWEHVRRTWATPYWLVEYVPCRRCERRLYANLEPWPDGPRSAISWTASNRGNLTDEARGART